MASIFAHDAFVACWFGSGSYIYNIGRILGAGVSMCVCVAGAYWQSCPQHPWL
jgi:hypothetical protein